MIKIRCFLVFLSLPFIFSCTGTPVQQETISQQPVQQEQISVTQPQRPPERPVQITLPQYIMGQGRVDGETLALFLQHNNPSADMDFVRVLAAHYVNEAAFEGVNHDIAFVQMCLETGFLHFGGDVKPEQYNFAGLGAIGNGEPGLSFPNPRIGVRAHIQHLKAYGSEEPLNGDLVNPRFRFVRRGSSPTYEGLAGTWAADRQYAVKINNLLQRLYDFAF
jgi:hypothetical protein